MIISAQLNRYLSKTKNHAQYRFTEQIIRKEIGLRPFYPARPKYRVNNSLNQKITKDIIFLTRGGLGS